MKEKTIEKIPYLTLPENNKKAKYVGITAFKNIAHEQHLFLEVYQNGKTGKYRLPGSCLQRKILEPIFQRQGSGRKVTYFQMVIGTVADMAWRGKKIQQVNIILKEQKKKMICMTKKI